jgi:hypothetical protein
MENFLAVSGINEMSLSEMEVVDGGGHVSDLLHAAWDGVCDYFGLQ